MTRLTIAMATLLPITCPQPDPEPVECAATYECLDACEDACDPACLLECWETSPDCLGSICVELECADCP